MTVAVVVAFVCVTVLVAQRTAMAHDLVLLQRRDADVDAKVAAALEALREATDRARGADYGPQIDDIRTRLHRLERTDALRQR